MNCRYIYSPKFNTFYWFHSYYFLTKKVVNFRKYSLISYICLYNNNFNLNLLDIYLFFFFFVLFSLNDLRKHKHAYTFSLRRNVLQIIMFSIYLYMCLWVQWKNKRFCEVIAYRFLFFRAKIVHNSIWVYDI